jgi:hypothetical protein
MTKFQSRQKAPTAASEDAPMEDILASEQGGQDDNADDEVDQGDFDDDEEEPESQRVRIVSNRLKSTKMLLLI